MPLKTKINYMMCGVCIYLTLVAAVTNNFMMLCIGFAGAIINWIAAENYWTLKGDE